MRNLFRVPCSHGVTENTGAIAAPPTFHDKIKSPEAATTTLSGYLKSVSTPCPSVKPVSPLPGCALTAPSLVTLRRAWESTTDLKDEVQRDLPSENVRQNIFTFFSESLPSSPATLTSLFESVVGQNKDSTGQTVFGDHESGDAGVEDSRTCMIDI